MTVLVSDSFNRADSTTTLGSTDSYAGGSAMTWGVIGTAVYGISSNQAYESTSANDNPAYVDLGANADNVRVSVDLATSSGIYNTGLAFRITDNRNYFRCYGTTASLKIDRMVNGTLTNIASVTLSGYTYPITFSVEVSGSTINYLVNAVQKGTLTDTNLQTATKHGLYLSGTAQRLDNFKVETLTSSGVNQPANAGAANGVATTSDAGVIGQQTTPGSATGVSSTNDTTPITLQQANAGPANGTSTGADFTSGAQSANAGPANGQASTADAVPIRILVAVAGAANGTSSSSDAVPILKQQAQAGTAAGTASTSWVVPRTGVDIQPDMFKILH